MSFVPLWSPNTRKIISRWQQNCKGQKNAHGKELQSKYRQHFPTYRPSLFELQLRRLTAPWVYCSMCGACFWISQQTKREFLYRESGGKNNRTRFRTELNDFLYLLVILKGWIRCFGCTRRFSPHHASKMRLIARWALCVSDSLDRRHFTSPTVWPAYGYRTRLRKYAYIDDYKGL